MDREAMLNRRANERVGSVLRDKWTLERLIGVGGMASVYAARHRNGKLGAVKLLHTELSMDSEWRERFLREGYVANAIGHPGVVAVLDDDTTEEGSVFLVMELLEGLPADVAASKSPGNRLDPREVVRIGDAVLDVLTAAHDKGIVHRDMKPENLFLTSDGQVKVLDFGIARLRERPAGSSATRTGATMGTPAYMPPEQALGHNHQIDGRTDIWGLGATLFTLLTGRYVHEADTANKLLLAAMTRHAPKVREFRPEVAPALADIVDRALAFEQSDRFESAREMQEALRALGDAPLLVSRDTPVIAVTVALSPTMPAPPALTASAVAKDSLEARSRTRRRGVPLLAAVIAAVAVAIGAIAVVMLRGDPASSPVGPEANAPALPALPAAAMQPPAVEPTREPVAPAPVVSPEVSAEPAPSAGGSAAADAAAPTASTAPVAPAVAPAAQPAAAPPRSAVPPPKVTTKKPKDPLGKW